jgi:hypothetical protein
MVTVLQDSRSRNWCLAPLISPDLTTADFILWGYIKAINPLNHELLMNSKERLLQLFQIFGNKSYKSKFDS